MGQALALDLADGSIVVGSGSILSRYSAQGDVLFERDTSSGVGNSGEPITDVIVRVDGRIVTVGTIVIGEPFGGNETRILTAMRLTPTGDLDPTFGVNGRFQLTSSASASGLQVAPLEWGKTLIGGMDGGKLIVLRLTPGGNLDPDFNGDGNTDGKVLVDFGAAATFVSASMVVLADGRILIGGTAGALAVHPEGKLLVAGRTKTASAISPSSPMDGSSRSKAHASPPPSSRR